MEQAPVSFREPLEKLADFEVIARHGPDQGHQFLAHIFGDGFLIHFEGEVVAALGGIFVQRALEKLQGVVDLELELFFAKLENFGLLAHKYAYIYAYL